MVGSSMRDAGGRIGIRHQGARVALVIAALMLPSSLHEQSTAGVPSAGAPASTAASTPATATSPSATSNPAPPAPTKTVEQSFVEGAPGIVGSLSGVLLTALLAWIVGLRLAALWDVRKKRSELNLLLTQELNKAIAEFKTIGREREVLETAEAAVAAASQSAGSAAPASRSDEIWKLHLGLVSRAIAAESSLEAILLKMVGDMEDAGLRNLQAEEVVAERARQIRIMGLTRVAFRRMREDLVSGNTRTTGYGQASYWLFNRLAADLSSMVAAGASLPRWWPWQVGRIAGPTASESYLRVLAYRTVDLHMAETALNTAVTGYEQKRDTARGRAWVANARKTFERNKIVVVERRSDGTDVAVDRGDLNRPVFIDIASRRTDAQAEKMADASFAARPALLWFVAVNGGGDPRSGAGARLLIKRRGGPMETYREPDRLPDALLHDGGARQTNSSALILLGWSQAATAPECIAAMATAALDP